MINKQAVARHFSRAADTYNDHTVIQQKMADRLLELIPEDFAPKSVVEIGSGTGYLSNLLSQRWPDCRLTLIDLSPGMIAKTRKELLHPSLQFCVADGEQPPPHLLNVDLIISSACFQWFNCPDKTAAYYLQNAPAGAMLAFSTFGPKTFCELHSSFKHAYQKNGLDYQRVQGQIFPSLEDWRSYLDNWRLFDLQEIEYTKHYRSVNSFLKAVRRAGANNALQRSKRTPLHVLKEMPEIYENLFMNSNGEIPVTYHAIFGTAFKP